MNPYETLGVPKTATPDQIRRAYRKRAAAAHPDNQDTGNRAAFEQITAANRLLSDPLSKDMYDQTGIVHGEDPLLEEALGLIVSMAAECVAANFNGDIPEGIKLRIRNAANQTDTAVATIEKAIKNIEERWTGGDTVKNCILANLSGQLLTLRKMRKSQSKALEVMEGSGYRMPQMPYASLGMGSELGDILFNQFRNSKR